MEYVTIESNEQQVLDCEDDKFGQGFGLWLEQYQSGEAGVFGGGLSPAVTTVLTMLDDI